MMIPLLTAVVHERLAAKKRLGGAQQSSAQQGTASQPQGPASILLLIMTSSLKLSETIPVLADPEKRSAEGNASQPLPALLTCGMLGLRCMAFTDDNDTPLPGNRESLMVLRPRDYLTHGMAGPKSCCNMSDERSFFCNPHRAQTLAAQYRFLPALAHARSVLATLHARSLRWVIVVDDDSLINARLLHRHLDALNYTEPWYGGDLAHWKAGQRSWDRENRHFPPSGTFACGGAGSLFSVVAMTATDFGSCARRLHTGCYQSDWMM